MSAILTGLSDLATAIIAIPGQIVVEVVKPANVLLLVPFLLGILGYGLGLFSRLRHGK
jgi:hypothetical protein